MSRKAIEKVAKMMDETGLMEITSETSLFWGILKRKIHLSKQNVCIAGTVGMPEKADSKKTDKKTESMSADGAITSPMVGVVYLAPDPTAKPFATVGKKVTAGETLCLVEAMKTFNPIKAPKDGVVDKILVKDGETVEFGTPLIVIK